MIRAAATQFSAHGYAAASTRAILGDAAATAPSLYHHFGSKQGLYLEVARAAQDHVLGTLSRAVVESDSMAERIHAALSAVADLRDEHPGVARFLHVVQADADRHPELEELRGGRQRLREFCQSAFGSAGREVPLALQGVIEGFLGLGGPAADLIEVRTAVKATAQLLTTGLP